MMVGISKNYIEIHDKDGVRTIDMTPVNEYLRIIRNSITSDGIHERRLSKNTSRLMEIYKELSGEQREYSNSNLLGILGEKTDILQRIYDKPDEFYKRIVEFRKIKDMADDVLKDIGLNEHDLECKRTSQVNFYNKKS